VEERLGQSERLGHRLQESVGRVWEMLLQCTLDDDDDDDDTLDLSASLCSNGALYNVDILEITA
jgi:hypothetical protein